MRKKITIKQGWSPTILDDIWRWWGWILPLWIKHICNSSVMVNCSWHQPTNHKYIILNTHASNCWYSWFNLCLLDSIELGGGGTIRLMQLDFSMNSWILVLSWLLICWFILQFHTYYTVHVINSYKHNLFFF